MNVAPANPQDHQAPQKRRRYLWHEYVLYALVTVGLLALGAVSLFIMLIGTLVTVVINPFKSIKHAAGTALVIFAFALGLFEIWYTNDTDLGTREISVWV